MFQLSWIRFFCYFFVALNHAAGQSVQSGHYFMVIDHSGSMLQKIRSGRDAGRSRWEVMRERAANFVHRLPEDSYVWAGIFSARPPDNSGTNDDPYSGWLTPFSAELHGAQAREDFIAKIKAYPEPALANGTWLYQATFEALERVAMAGQRDPEAYLTVMVYTDGVDQGYGRTSVEMMRNPASPCTREDLEKRINQLKKLHRNFNVVNVYSPGDESILDAHVVRLKTNRFHLASPLVQSEQSIDLEMQFFDDSNWNLEGRPLGAEWQIAESSNSAAKVEIMSGPLTLRNGSLPVKLKISSQDDAGKDLHAILKLKYPKIDQVFLVEEGGTQVDFHFQGAKAPEIRDLLPADGTSFPVGRKVGFSLTSLPGCQVEWNLGDGTLLKGNPVEHSFREPGKKQIAVKVTDAHTGLSVTGSLTLLLTELQIRLDPITDSILPGKQVELRATTVGKFRSVEWQVGERIYVGRPRRDGVAGSELLLSLDRPGAVAIRAWGEGVVGGRAETEIAQIQVKEVPAIRLTAPADGEVLYFGSKREFRAEVEGVDANQLKFTLSSEGKDLMPASTVDVRREGSLRSAALPVQVPQLPQKIVAKLRVETLGVQPPLSREIHLRFEGEPATLAVVLPEGREPHIHRETTVRLESNVKLSKIRWDFGEGWRDGGEIERQTWKSYGSQQIKAQAIAPDGTELTAVPVEIRVPVRPVKVDASVIYKGKRVGAEVAKVPVNATLELRGSAEGDVTRSRWLLDGKELPAGQETVTVRERGFKSLEFFVDGTKEAGGVGAGSAKIEFRISDKILFWASVAGMLLALCAANRLLAGNHWRCAKIEVFKHAEKPGAVRVGLPARGRMINFPWTWSSWWTKRCVIAWPDLDKDFAREWSKLCVLELQTGRDVTARAKGENSARIGLTPEDRNNQRQDYLQGWSFLRAFVPKDEKSYYGALRIRFPKGKLGPPLSSRWPELLLLITAGLSLLLLRRLYEMFF